MIIDDGRVGSAKKKTPEELAREVEKYIYFFYL